MEKDGEGRRTRERPEELQELASRDKRVTGSKWGVKEREREGKPGMSYPWVLSLGSTGLLMWRRFVKGKGENGWWWKGKRKKIIY